MDFSSFTVYILLEYIIDFKFQHIFKFNLIHRNDLITGAICHLDH